MKTGHSDTDQPVATDPRHQRRIQIVQHLFASLFTQEQADKNKLDTDETGKIIQLIHENISTLDALIQQFAPRYSLDKIARVDLCILRLALYELTIERSEPEKVIINEAVDLAKELGGDRSYAFINAVLGAATQKN